MGRSSGARPRKAVREQVLALRAKLGTIRSDKWQAAQAVFDEMCALCGVEGPSHGMMTPRACRVCHYYGHSRATCPVWLARRAHMSAREVELDAATGFVWPESEAECSSAAQWEWVQRMRAIDARNEKLIARGLGCKRTVSCASDIDLACACEGCVAWRTAWVGEVC